jgi:hypothetical protein
VVYSSLLVQSTLVPIGMAPRPMQALATAAYLVATAAEAWSLVPFASLQVRIGILVGGESRKV